MTQQKALDSNLKFRPRDKIQRSQTAGKSGDRILETQGQKLSLCDIVY